ncbi:bifunctional glycosyltransferase/CDP-glycerol:glycerophosphate glycerophosphotransferase [Oceanobacillus jordanicus]|uniref:bifunctional glycosyltransferase/CDP-glycerol:glycerophosphate glycerophosphotransferase n=1 Tax=Oceanobacillus jordanicus TaxID=2867266 RepID=UPI001EDECFC1
MNKISIIIPVYNTEEYLKDCITSVLKQTYQNLEVILVNDGSNESCTAYLKSLLKLDDRLHLYEIDKRVGTGAARNFGIEKSTGDFLYFLDSDDYLPEKTLEILVNNIKDHKLIRGRIKKTNFSKSIAIILEGLFKVKLYSDKKYNLLKNKSVLNTLIRKDFVLNEKLNFSEKNKIYSDLKFIVPAFQKAEVVPYLKEAIYFKRNRNDPVLNPSLIQLDKEYRIKDFITMYNHLKDEYEDVEVNNYLDVQFLNFYRKTIVTYFKENNGVDQFFDDLSSSVEKMEQNVLNRYGVILRREIKTILKGDKRKYKKMNSLHQLLRDIKDGLKTRRKFFVLLYRRVFMRLPIKENVVFFESFLGKSYSDSPKYIYEYLLNNNLGYKCVWSVRETKDIPGNPIQVKRFSLRYFYYLARAKYWVSNIRLPKSLNKREGNVYLQTWHGTPLKTLVLDQKDIFSADPKYKENFYIQSRRWDYLSSPNQYSSDIFRRAFKFEKEMLEFGYPRNDILYQKNNDSNIKEMKEKLQIPLNKKVILYAPTWRDDEFFSRGNYKFTLRLELDKMQENLSDDYIILLRTHYHIANRLDVSDYQGFVYDFSVYDDIAELYLVSDILITDYSSVFFDYAHLKRPILFYTYDIEKYRDQLRGFYFDMEQEVPGPLLMTTDEVVNAVENINEVSKKYSDKYENFYNKYCLWDDGQASEKTVKAVFHN